LVRLQLLPILRHGAGQIEAVGRRSDFSARGGPTSGSFSISHFFWGTVLREVRMSQREEQSFKIVAGLVAVGALVIAAVMAMV